MSDFGVLSHTMNLVSSVDTQIAQLNKMQQQRQLESLLFGNTQTSASGITGLPNMNTGALGGIFQNDESFNQVPQSNFLGLTKGVQQLNIGALSSLVSKEDSILEEQIASKALALALSIPSFPPAGAGAEGTEETGKIDAEA